MTTAECARARDLAPDLVLGILDGAERARVLEHVHRCPGCQAHVADLTGAADALVHLAPEIEPPPGFGDRVVAAVGRPRRRRRRRLAVLAAAVAVAVIATVVAVRVIDAGRSDVAVAPAVTRSAMVGSDGIRVGDVVTAVGEATSLAIAVDYAVPDGRYDVVVRSRRGSEVVGSMRIAGGTGEWTGPIVDGPHPDASVDLVDADGDRVCSADVGDV